MNQWDTDDVRVHSFVDGQMDADEKRRFLQELAGDAKLQEQVCQLRGLKEYVSSAYEIQELPGRGGQSCRSGRQIVKTGMAAMLLLAFGFTLGWVSHGERVAMVQPTTFDADTTDYGDGRVGSALAFAHERILLHIGQSDPAKFDDVLDQAERLLKTYKEQNIQVEVIANAGGLDLVREDASPYAQRVRDMIVHYPNLRFVACANAIRQMEQGGVKMVLVKDTRIAPSAVEHIIERIHEGWVYIKV
jgi:intracellular sulfur oxidation DsrE/DsrF family protein